MAKDDCVFLGEEITPDPAQVGGRSIKLWCKRAPAEDSTGIPYGLPCFDCDTGLPICEGYISKTMCSHRWTGCDDLVFVRGKNKGAIADVFCMECNCNMGAFVDEQGHIILHSISEVGFNE
jgi:hypothetical protein